MNLPNKSFIVLLTCFTMVLAGCDHSKEDRAAKIVQQDAVKAAFFKEHKAVTNWADGLDYDSWTVDVENAVSGPWFKIGLTAQCSDVVNEGKDIVAYLSSYDAPGVEMVLRLTITPEQKKLIGKKSKEIFSREYAVVATIDSVTRTHLTDENPYRAKGKCEAILKLQ